MVFQPRLPACCAAVLAMTPWLGACGDNGPPAAEPDYRRPASCSVTSTEPEVKCPECTSVAEYTIRCEDETFGGNPINLELTGSTVVVFAGSNRAYYPLLLSTTSGTVSLAPAYLARLWQLWLVSTRDTPRVVERERGLAVEYRGSIIEIPDTSPLPIHENIACRSVTWPVSEGSTRCPPICTDRRRGVEPKTASTSVDSSGELWLAWRYTKVEVTHDYEYECGFDDCLCYAKDVRDGTATTIQVVAVSPSKSTVRHVLEVPVRPTKWDDIMFEALDIHASVDRLLLAHAERTNVEYRVGEPNYRLRLLEFRR